MQASSLQPRRHADLLNLDEEQFLAQYPVGKRFRMNLTVRVLEEEPFILGLPHVGRVN
jgi:hypothetical protein